MSYEWARIVSSRISEIDGEEVEENKNYSVRGPREECGVCNGNRLRNGTWNRLHAPVSQIPHNLKRQKVKRKARSPHQSPTSSFLNYRTPPSFVQGRGFLQRGGLGS